MTGPQIFAFAWGVVFACLGFVFARYPEQMEAEYRRRMDSRPFVRRIRETYAPTDVVLTWYRVGGVVGILLGLAVSVAAAIGVLS